MTVKMPLNPVRVIGIRKATPVGVDNLQDYINLVYPRNRKEKDACPKPLVSKRPCRGGRK